jgi:hypothetical protein
MSDVMEKIEKLYKFKTYGDLYGGHVIVLLFIVTLVVGYVTYVYIDINRKGLRKDWNNIKCHPLYIPFAGFIQEDDADKMKEYTTKNFYFCVSETMNQIFKYFTKPIEHVSLMVISTLNNLFSVINKIREKILDVNNNFSKVVRLLYGRLLNIMIPLQNIVTKMKDMMGKVQGILVGAIFSLLNLYYAMISMMKGFVRGMIVLMLIIAAAIVPLWVFPFTWPMAVAGTALLATLVGFMGVITGNVADILYKSGFNPFNGSGYPVGVPSCFDGDTKLRLHNNTYKKIRNLKVGDVLHDDGKVNGIFELDATGVQMYRIPTSNKKHTIVSGTHYVYDMDAREFIKVQDYAKAIPISHSEYNSKKIYCIITQSKTIHVGNQLFSDWDDLEVEQMSRLIKTQTDIVDTMYGGWFAFTKIRLQDGSFKYIYDIQPGDILENNNRVVGLCKIEARNNYDYYVINESTNDMSVFGGTIMYDDIKYLKDLAIRKYDSSKPLILYNIVTETGTYNVNEVCVNDVNHIIEKYFGY